MKTGFIICALFIAIIVYSCSKSHTQPVPPISPAVAENYLTSGPWIFTGSYMLHHAVIYDSVAFFFCKQVSDNEYIDSIAAYYPGRLVIFTFGRFIVSSTYNSPDTLISPFSPYTASGSQLDTFLIRNLSSKLFTMERYSVPPAPYPVQQDTLIRR